LDSKDPHEQQSDSANLTYHTVLINDEVESQANDRLNNKEIASVNLNLLFSHRPIYGFHIKGIFMGGVIPSFL